MRIQEIKALTDIIRDVHKKCRGSRILISGSASAAKFRLREGQGHSPIGKATPHKVSRVSIVIDAFPAVHSIKAAPFNWIGSDMPEVDSKMYVYFSITENKLLALCNTHGSMI